MTEDYLVAGRIRLGTLLDLIATFLDTLDTLFDLYADPTETEAGSLSAEAAESTSAESSRAT